MNIFIDMEFSGLHKRTTPISIGIVSENDDTFYAEFNDYDKNQIDDWLQENVINNLSYNDDYKTLERKGNNVSMKGSKFDVTVELIHWLSQWEYIELWSDCYAYDIVLFHDLFGHAFHVPEQIYYIPFDLSTLMKVKGIDPDVNREAFVGLDGASKHNSLWDAVVIKECYEKLMGGN